MKSWQTREDLLAQATTLACHGMSVRSIARTLGVSRNTVRKLLVAHQRAREEIAPDSLPQPPSRAPHTVVQVFAYVLTYSTRKHFALYERCDLHALMEGHVAAFERFDGAAHRCKYDGQKTVVLRWEGSQPIYNPRFLAFCAHYEMLPVACRRWHPNDKPRVERAFSELERSFLNGRAFRDLADMRAQLLVWEDTVADLRPRKRRCERPRMEAFADEQPLLRPLPRHPYDTARVVYRVCAIDGYVSWDGNRYAVPYEHVTVFLPVRITQNELFVYAADFRCVARHALAPRSAGEDVGAERYHPRSRWAGERRGAADLEQLRVTYAGMGEAAAAFLDALCRATPRLATYQARRILLLREHYSTDELCAALHHAQAYGAFEHQAVERILAARGTPRRLAEYVADDLAKRLGPGPGTAASKPPDLSEYDELPPSGSPPSPKETPCRDEASLQTTSSSPDCDEPSTSSD